MTQRFLSMRSVISTQRPLSGRSALTTQRPLSGDDAFFKTANALSSTGDDMEIHQPLGESYVGPEDENFEDAIMLGIDIYEIEAQASRMGILADGWLHELEDWRAGMADKDSSPSSLLSMFH